jgi:hypothetical protein
VSFSPPRHQWLKGKLRDVQLSSDGAVGVSIPVGGTPPSTVAGVTIPGTAPTYINVSEDSTAQILTIDGPDGLRYVARSNRHLEGLIVNDPIDFAVEGRFLFVRGVKKGKEYKLLLTKTIRLEQP